MNVIFSCPRESLIMADFAMLHAVLFPLLNTSKHIATVLSGTGVLITGLKSLETESVEQ